MESFANLKLFCLAILVVFSVCPAFARLSRSQRIYVAQQVQAGNYGVLEHLSVGSQSLEEANVDTESMINMIQSGDVRMLMDRRLRFNLRPVHSAAASPHDSAAGRNCFLGIFCDPPLYTVNDHPTENECWAEGYTDPHCGPPPGN